MPENTWVPKIPQNQLAAIASNSTPTMPEIELPSVGAVICLQILPWGAVQIVGDQMHVQNGSNVVVVEVKEIKKAKIVLE